MNEENVVNDTEQDTVAFSTDAEQTADDVSEESVSEDVNSAETTEAEQPSRANERIRQLIAERDEALQEAEYYRGQNSYYPDSEQEELPQAAPQTLTPQQMSQVNEVFNIRQQQSDAEKEHPELVSSDAFAKAVAGAWEISRRNGETKTFSQVAKEVKDSLVADAKQQGSRETLKEVAASANVAGSQAGKSATKNRQELSREVIANMSDSEYEERHDEIKDWLATQ
jgi:hypothetical protein